MAVEYASIFWFSNVSDCGLGRNLDKSLVLSYLLLVYQAAMDVESIPSYTIV